MPVLRIQEQIMEIDVGNSAGAGDSGNFRGSECGAAASAEDDTAEDRAFRWNPAANWCTDR